MKLQYDSKEKDKSGLDVGVTWVRAKLIFLENLETSTHSLGL